MEDGLVNCLILLQAQNVSIALAMNFKQEANEALLWTPIPCPQVFVFAIYLFSLCSYYVIEYLNCCNIDPL